MRKDGAYFLKDLMKALSLSEFKTKKLCNKYRGEFESRKGRYSIPEDLFKRILEDYEKEQSEKPEKMYSINDCASAWKIKYKAASLYIHKHSNIITIIRPESISDKYKVYISTADFYKLSDIRDRIVNEYGEKRDLSKLDDAEDIEPIRKNWHWSKITRPSPEMGSIDT